MNVSVESISSEKPTGLSEVGVDGVAEFARGKRTGKAIG